MDKKINSLLLKSFDTRLNKKEQQQLEKALAQSESLRLEKKKLEQMRGMLVQNQKHTFRPFFAERVMTRIKSMKKPETKFDVFFDSLVNAFRPLVAAIIILIIIALSFNAFNNNGSVFAGIITDPQISIEDSMDPAWIYFEE